MNLDNIILSLEDERYELLDKLDDLEYALLNNDKISFTQKELLFEQAFYMKKYSEVLGTRIQNLKEENEENY